VAHAARAMSVALCIAAAMMIRATLPVDAFTLAWTHSIEKIRWEEDWRVEPGGLRLAAARVRGSGAGMEPPDGAVLRDGVWHWHPDLAPQRRLTLAVSPFTSDYELCTGAGCRALTELAGIGLEPATIDLIACPVRRSG